MPARTRLPKWPTLNLERELGGVVCGVDEAGYAPLAGPVVAAAVVLPCDRKPRELRGLTDSKLLDAAERARFFDIIHRIAEVGVGIATVAEIDELNIFRADMLAMQRAVAALGIEPDAALVDGRGAPAVSCEVKTVIKGDRRCLSIAAASVIAKVARDRSMQTLAADCPGYGWETNVGYGTDEHYLGLLRHGPTEHHRRSFAPINTLFNPDSLPLHRFFFEPVGDDLDLEKLETLELRHDLHVVFDGRGRHLGQVKNLRGRWRFHAVGYGADREPDIGAGPCACCHGASLGAPAVIEVRQLLASALG